MQEETDELSEKSEFIKAVEMGLKEIEEGKTVPIEKVKEIIDGWSSKQP